MRRHYEKQNAAPVRRRKEKCPEGGNTDFIPVRALVKFRPGPGVLCPAHTARTFLCVCFQVGATSVMVVLAVHAQFCC